MNDTNQHIGNGRLGVEPKFFNEDTAKPFARLFALMNESYEKNGNKVEKTQPVNIVLSRKADVELVHKSHTGTAVSWTGESCRCVSTRQPARSALLSMSSSRVPARSSS